MSKNLYRVCKKSDLDELIKNNFFKPICIIFTTKKIEKAFEDNIASLFKSLSKNNTYCLHLLINLDNFIDNINFFSEMRNNSPNFIAYFKGRQISSFSNTQNNNEIFLNSTKDIINKINSSYIQKLVVSFNQNEMEKDQKNNNNQNYENNKVNQNNHDEDDDNEEVNQDEKDNDDDDEKDNDDENNDDDDDDDDDNDDNNDDDDNDDDNKIEKDEEKNLNNIKKRNTETASEKKKIDISKVDLSKVDLSKVDLSKVDINKVDLNKVDLSKVDLSKVDLDQLSIDKKKEKLKALLELKKQAQKNN